MSRKQEGGTTPARLHATNEKLKDKRIPPQHRWKILRRRYPDCQENILNLLLADLGY